MTYDPKCYELADSFLDDAGLSNDMNSSRLARVIQAAIESEIEEIQQELKDNAQLGVGA